jgi:hypothetical protein
MFKRFAAWLGPMENSIQGHINSGELARSILSGMGFGSVVALVIAILGAVSAHASQIFPDAKDAGQVVFVLGAAIEILRRLNHDGPAPEVPADGHPDALSIFDLSQFSTLPVGGPSATCPPGCPRKHAAGPEDDPIDIDPAELEDVPGGKAEL